MKRHEKIVLWLIIAFTVSIALGAWTTYDYGLGCNKCLANKQLVEQRYFGILFFRRTIDLATPPDYEHLFGHPCKHVFHKEGFGVGWHGLLRSGVGCGSTGEGMLFRPRVKAVRATYDAGHRLGDAQLALTTFQFIDSLMPADGQIQRRDDRPPTAPRTLLLLGTSLRATKTVEEWQCVMESARAEFRDASRLSDD